MLAFVLIGRRSHTEALAFLGVLGTAGPFLAGLVAGWLLARGWRSPRDIRYSGLVIWVTTVAVGMLLRAVTGEGVPLGFVIVTAVVLGILLLGWRAIAGIVVRVRRRSTASPSPRP